jgi:hypothetical protein
MARFNEMLVGRYNNALRKMFAMKGAAPAPQVGGEFMPTMPFSFGVEFRFLEEWTRFAAPFALGAGGAGNFSAARIRNPVGSGVIGVLEKVTGSLGSPGGQINLFLEAQTADFATGMTNSRLDARGRPTSTLTTSSKNNTVTLGGTFLIDLAQVVSAGAGYDFINFENQELTLLPGDACTLIAGNANQLLNGSFRWRERALEESERQ